MSKITAAKAEKVRKSVAKTYATYIEAGYPEPETRQDEHGTWHIIWNDGPYEWAYHFSAAIGSDQMYRVHDPEFGFSYPEPSGLPAGVFLEPVNYSVLGIYEA